MADDTLEALKELLDASKRAGKRTNGSFKTGELDPLIKALQQAASSSELKKLNQSYREAIKNSKLSAEAEKAALKALEDSTEQQEKLIKASTDLNEKLYTLARSTRLNVVQSQRLADRAVETRKVLGDLGEAAGKGTGKITDFTSAFKGKFGGIGDIVVGAGAGLQANVDTFRTLSSVGAAFGQDLVQLREAAATAGLPIEDFTKLIKNNAQGLAQLYGTTTQGAQSFSRLSRNFRDLNSKQLMPLGFTTEELNEALMTSQEIQRMTGTLDLNDTYSQMEAGKALVLEIDKLAKATGMQRDEVQKSLKAQLTQTTFLAFMQGQTEETRLRLQTFATTITNAAPEMKAGLLDLIASGGIPTTKAAEDLILNLRGSGEIVKQVTRGQIDAATAVGMMQQEASKSVTTFRDVAKVGVVPFVNNLYGASVKLKSAQIDLGKATDEQRKKASDLTEGLTGFEKSAKEVSAAFQSLETGFLGVIGDTFGKGLSTTNKMMSSVASGIMGMNNASKALLYSATSIGSYVLDKATQAAVVFTGTYKALVLSGAGKAGGFTSAIGGKDGKYAKAGSAAMSNMPKALKFGGAAIATSLAASAVGTDTMVGKGLDVAGYGLTGAAIGSMFAPVIGTAVGGAIGTILGLYQNSRATGTLGEIGKTFEPKTSMLKVHAGERVLNPAETQEYNQGKPDAAQSQRMLEFTQTTKQLLEAQNMTNQLLNKQVSIQMATEKNTKKTSKVVDKVGSSII
jgi:hypothetical protein